MLDYFSEYPAQYNNSAGHAQPPFYYSFDVANIHFIGLMSEMDAGDTSRLLFNRFKLSDQVAWLEEDLKTTSQTWKIAFFHHPFENSNLMKPYFGAIFNQYNVQLALSGHRHHYALHRRLEFPTTIADTGTMAITSGGGSGGLGACPATLKERNILCKSLFHYMQFEVSHDEILFSAYDTLGNMFNAWKLPYVGQPESLGVSAIQRPILDLTDAQPIQVEISSHPFTPVTFLKYSVKYMQAVRTEVININGQRVFAAFRNRVAGSYSEKIDFRPLPSGVYIVRLYLDNRNMVWKRLYIR
jgi:hypothetical protein